ncbi:MAG: hypothetical protein JW973_09725 [Bacteroidales bacterium]|nr:hypothetical protein [Bacteroidales bacterium]
MHKDEIILLMKQNQPNFKLDRNSVNRSYNCIKFVDKISEQTILFFLSQQDKCTYVRWMSDYSNLNEIITELNNKYKKKDKVTWCYMDKGQEYIVKLEKGQWFFTVSIRKK